MKIGNIIYPEHALFLAPMEDVTDFPFRELCLNYGADATYTEFISCEGFIRNIKKFEPKIKFNKSDKPVAVQIFGSKPDSIKQTVEILEAYQPDIIDLNFGCPAKKIVNKGGGAALLKDLDLMQKIAKIAVNTTKIPITAKTRLGWDNDTIVIQEVTKRLQDAGVQALAIHGRTRTQQYKGTVNWDFIKNVKNNPQIKIPIIGNGNIDSYSEYCRVKQYSGVDAVMIGRAAIGRPWIFEEIKSLNNGKKFILPNLKKRIDVCKEHLSLTKDFKPEIIAIREFRKHYANYFKGIPFFKPYRMQLMQAQTYTDVLTILDAISKA